VRTAKQHSAGLQHVQSALVCYIID